MAETPSIEDFYREHSPAVYALLVSLCRDPVSAEDLMQDTFAKATRSLGGYRGGDPRSWLFTIARSVFVDDVRPPPPTGEQLEQSAADPDVTEIEVISGILAMLPERQRTALLLADQAGLSMAEIAATLGISVGAAKVLVHRGRLRFRRFYQEEAGE